MLKDRWQEPVVYCISFAGALHSVDLDTKQRRDHLVLFLQALSFPGCPGQRYRWQWPLLGQALCPQTSTCTLPWCIPGQQP